MRTRLVTPLLALSLLVAACGDDGGDSTDPDDPTTTTTVSSTTTTGGEDGDDTGADDGDDDGGDDTATTTTVGDTSTTTEPADGPTGVLAEGAVTTDAGLTATWDLNAESTSLCFTADLSHSDPDEAAVVGDGVSACLTPDGGLDDMPSGLSVDVGTVDGDKTIGYLWGRADASVIRLTIEHTDGTQTDVPLLAGPTDVQVFAFVVDTSTIPGVIALDAVSGEGIEGSAEIRDFLRAGPTYPVVTPTTTVAPPDYPTN